MKIFLLENIIFLYYNIPQKKFFIFFFNGKF